MAPQPGRGVEMAHLEAFSPPTEAEAAALAALWNEVAPDASARAGRRDLLLPALRALQAARGWVSPEGIAAVCRELTVAFADAYGVASFYHLLETEPGPRRVLHVCDDLACRRKGAEALIEALKAHLDDEEGASKEIGWSVSPCLGQCDRAPAALVDEETWVLLTPDEVTLRVRALQECETDGRRSATTSGPAPAPPRWAAPPTTYVGSVGTGSPLLLRRCSGTRTGLSAYLRAAGYTGLRKALDAGANGVLREIEASRLVGRGGAAFPTALKWRAVADEPGGTARAPKYVVCNADESEPGTFKDRILLEQDPFAIIEGMTIAGFAVGASRGYLYIRGEYPEAYRSVVRAVEEARAHGYLGDALMGETPFTFDIEVRRGAGAYVCGEETALINSIEGRRGEPRARPPFPTRVGLFGCPTLVNNVETLACVPHILAQGGEWYAGLGTEGSRGTKLVCISGDVSRPGVYEAPFGVPIQALIDEAGGGVPGKRQIQAVLCGGAAGTFLTPEQLDLPYSIEALRGVGATVGSGAIIVYDETADLGDALERIARFFMDESCGQCVPCRVGTRRQWELVRALRSRQVEDVAAARRLLDDLSTVMRDASICGLGQLASNALLSLEDRLYS